MPWQGVSPVDLRIEFTRAYVLEHGSMTELCEQYGVATVEQVFVALAREAKRHGD